VLTDLWNDQPDDAMHCAHFPYQVFQHEQL
jgi:hypothetical protein